MPLDNQREQAKSLLQDLLLKYKRVRAEVVKPGSEYNEAQLRNDYLNPLLRLLGWDVENQKGAPQYLREVVHETTVAVEEGDASVTKNPDYALRVGSERKLFIEAKKPSVPIETAKEPAFQVRRYGWSADMRISVLTNFDKLAIYDCQIPPNADNLAHIARVHIYDHTEYLTHFDAIYDLLSRDAVYQGSIEGRFPEDRTDPTKQAFDDYFLHQIEEWRELIAQDLLTNNGDLGQGELNFLVQRLLNRIIFLRICEDRRLETYEQLKKVISYEQLKDLFIEADQRYNSGLFDFIEDSLSLGITLNSNVLIGIFRQLYYPNSPYNFAVVEADVLGQVYELFLSRKLFIEEDNSLRVAPKPEVVASEGVVPTPKYIVDEIVKRTIGPLCQGASPDEISNLRIADICCGSGAFLLSAYEYLLNYHREWYITNGPHKFPDKVYEVEGHSWYLTLAEKHRILLANIFGVDIDPEAAEVTQFSLLLKVLEDESSSTIRAYSAKGLRALPKLGDNIKSGNSLVDRRFFDVFPAALTNEVLLAQARPLTWAEEFGDVMTAGGFDAIIGNPPYIRIQNMVQYSPEEVQYYKRAGYNTAQQNNFDKYYLFVEHALSLLKPQGYLGYIIPHKFFSIKAGEGLRRIISVGKHLHDIVYFGAQQVFPNRSTYTAIVVLHKEEQRTFTFAKVDDIRNWRATGLSQVVEYQASEFTSAPWVFVSQEAQATFQKVRNTRTWSLNEVADIFVGLQTSADNIYIIKSDEIIELDHHVVFDKQGKQWTIERDILRPCLYDAPLQPFSKASANAWIIFPYRIQDGQASLYTEEEMDEYFPLCWRYLMAHKGVLETRSISGRRTTYWYQYGRSQSLTRFDGRDKLVWPVLARDAPYAYDDRNIMFTGGGNGPYYALRPKSNTAVSIYYLLAVLSHPVIEAIVKASPSIFRGGYYTHGKEFIRWLPIKQINPNDQRELSLYTQIVEDSQRLVELRTTSFTLSTPHQRRLTGVQINALSKRIQGAVSHLYGLDQQDLVAIQDRNITLTAPLEE